MILMTRDDAERMLDQKILFRLRERAATPTPLVAVDECLNEKVMRPVLDALQCEGRVADAIGLWRAPRYANGMVTNFDPYRYPSARRHGRPFKGERYLDEWIAQKVVMLFGMADRVVVLTANTSNDRRGLRRLLKSAVGPALESRHSERLGLLVIYKRGKASWTEYARDVRRTLERGDPVPVGFSVMLAPLVAARPSVGQPTARVRRRSKAI